MLESRGWLFTGHLWDTQKIKSTSTSVRWKHGSWEVGLSLWAAAPESSPVGGTAEDPGWEGSREEGPAAPARGSQQEPLSARLSSCPICGHGSPSWLVWLCSNLSLPSALLHVPKGQQNFLCTCQPPVKMWLWALGEPLSLSLNPLGFTTRTLIS